MNMEKDAPVINLLAEIIRVLDLERDDIKSRFTDLYGRTYNLLGWDDYKAAVCLGASVPNAKRWKNGMVPPATKLILMNCKEELEKIIQ